MMVSNCSSSEGERGGEGSELVAYERRDEAPELEYGGNGNPGHPVRVVGELLSSRGPPPSASAGGNQDGFHGMADRCPPGWNKGRQKVTAVGPEEVRNAIAATGDIEESAPGCAASTGEEDGVGVDNQRRSIDRRSRRRSRAAPVGSTFNEALVFWDAGGGAEEEESRMAARDNATVGPSGRPAGECDNNTTVCRPTSRAKTAENLGCIRASAEGDEACENNRREPPFSFFESRKLWGGQGSGNFRVSSEGEGQNQDSNEFRCRSKASSAPPSRSSSAGSAPTREGCPNRNKADVEQQSPRRRPSRSTPTAAAVAKQQQPKPRMSISFLKKVRYSHLQSGGAGTMPREELGGPVVYRGHLEERLERHAALDARKKQGGVPLSFHPVRVLEHE